MIAVARALLVISVLLLGLALHSRNHQAVMLDLYLRRAELPLSWVLVGAFASGAMCGVVAMIPRIFGLRRALRRERKLTKIAQSGSTPSAPHGP